MTPKEREAKWAKWPQGDAGDAIDWALDHCKEPVFFLEDWRADRASEWDDYMRWLKAQRDGARSAQAGEAGTAETTEIGSVHEHAVAESDAPVIGPKGVSDDE